MRNKLSALALTAALLLAPYTTALATSASVLHTMQQDEVPSDAEQAMFTRGQNLYNQSKYEQAVAVLRDFLKTYPNSIIKDLTLLWLGRAYMQMNRLQEAEQVGQQLRTIKDTPFVEIYEGELQAARREAANKPAPVTPPGRQTRTEVASTGTATTTPKSTPPRPAPTAAPTSQARLIDRITVPSETAGNTTSQVPGAENRGNIRDRRRVKSRPTSTPPLVATDTNQPAPKVTSQQPTASPTPSSGTTQVAANNNATRTPPVTPPPAPVRSVEPHETTTRPTPTPSAPTAETVPIEGGGIRITVKQVPRLELALRRPQLAASPGQSVQLPLVVTNSGNKEDQFRLETDLPAEYQPTFSLAQSGTDTGLPILVTQQLARGASLDVMLNIRVPETAADGQQRRFFVRAASQADFQVTRVADAALTVVAAALAASSGVSQDSVLPGGTFRQTITVKNQGSAPARSSRADFVFNPDFELVSASPSPLVYDRASRTAIWSLGDIDVRDGREISVTLRAVPDALASTKALGRGTMRSASLSLASNFDGPSIAVGRVTRANIEAVSTGLTATPGDAIFIPFVVRNPGNYAESFDLRITAPGAPAGTLYADLNGDGQHQENEPAVTQTAKLDPRGGQFPMLLRIEIPRTTPDRQQFAYNIVARSTTENRIASEASTVLTVAAPRVRVRTEQVTDTAAPGDAIFYRLVLVNEGSGLAKNLVVTELLPDALQFVSSNPPLNPQDAPGNTQRFVWRVAELAPNDTSVLLIAVRLRPNLQAETTLPSRHTLTYQDTNNNSYQGQ